MKRVNIVHFCIGGIRRVIKRILDLIFLKSLNLLLTKAPELMVREEMGVLKTLVYSSVDFFRLSTLKMVLKDIEDRGLLGSMAEVGVFRGEFASMINKLCPDRTFYLFDTFEGFSPKEFEHDVKAGFSDYWQDFVTDDKVVLKKMSHPDNVIIRKGFFPETAALIDDNFVFVSIDVDLFEPTLNGLNFFYPNLAKGGYIFVHDYNHSLYRGVKKAVSIFCNEHDDISYVPIGDWGGTVVLKKI